jgi:hypothetical protein
VRAEPQDGQWSMLDAAKMAQAVGQLVCFALDELWQDDQFDGCCPHCCAACGGINMLLELGVLDQVVAVAEGVAYGSPWWSAATGQVDLGFLERAWRMTTCHPDLTERHSTATEG